MDTAEDLEEKRKSAAEATLADPSPATENLSRKQIERLGKYRVVNSLRAAADHSVWNAGLGLGDYNSALRVAHVNVVEKQADIKRELSKRFSFDPTVEHTRKREKNCRTNDMVCHIKNGGICDTDKFLTHTTYFNNNCMRQMKKWAGNGTGQLLQMSVGMRQSPYYFLGISTKRSPPLQTLIEATKVGTPDSHGPVHLVVASPPSLCTLQVAAKQLLQQYLGPALPEEISVTFH